MKILVYTEGPEIMTCGIAGEFRIGEPREVSDDLAAILLRKGRLKEFKENPPAIGDTMPHRVPRTTTTKKEE
jgi:hypothetical protein